MNFSKSLSLFLFSACILLSNAQEKKSHEDFLRNVENVLTQLENFTNHRNSGINITNRKIQIEGENEATKISFTLKIKVSKKI